MRSYYNGIDMTRKRLPAHVSQPMAFFTLKKPLQKTPPLVEEKELSVKVETLHRYVAQNNVQAANELLQHTPIDQLPFLLKEKSQVKTSAKGLSNHIVVRGTALSMALGFRAVKINENEEGMVEMLQRHLRRAMPGGEGELEIARQTLQQFPSRWQEEEKAQYSLDQSACMAFQKTVADSKSDEYPARRLKPAREVLRKHFEPNPEKVLETGYFGKTKLLAEIFRVSSEAFFDESYGGGYVSTDSYNRNAIFCNRCIGWLQRLEPEARKQEMAQGLHNPLKHAHKPNYALKYTLGEGNFVLTDSDKGIGFDSWVDVSHGAQFHGIARTQAHSITWWEQVQITKDLLKGCAEDLLELCRRQDAAIESYIESAEKVLRQSAAPGFKR